MTTNSPRTARLARPHSRRSFLSGAAALGAGAFLASCASPENTARREVENGTFLRVVNWPEYIDPVSIDQVIADTTIQNIDYREEYFDNFSGFDEIIEPALSSGGEPGFDIVVPTQWVAGRMIANGWVEELPLENIPNHVNLDPRFMTSDFDRGSRFQIPWQGGMTGIAYDPEAVGGEITSVTQLFDTSNDALRGRVGLVGEMREAVGLAMLANGDDPARPTEAAATAGLNLLTDLAGAGHFRSVVFDDFVGELQAGRLLASMAWSGQAAALQLETGQFEFIIPDEGAISWFDTMVIPRNATNYAAAAAWMNWAYDPANAAQITAFNLYVSPVLGTQNALRALGGFEATLADNTLIFPDTATRNRLFTWGDLERGFEDQLEDDFAALTEQIGFAS